MISPNSCLLSATTLPLWLVLTLALVTMGWARPAAASGEPTSARFEALRSQDLKVASVAYRLSLANSALCGHSPTPQHGLILHSLEQYGAVDREEAALHFGLGAHVNVMAVVEGSPAARAGVTSDDRLLSVNGKSLIADAAALKAKPSRASVQRAQRLLLDEMKKGETVLRVSGSRGERHVRFRADPGCPADVELLPGDDVNAWADGERVVVSAGILRRCRNNDDLALVIAHELAHNLLHHGRRSTAAADRQGRLFLPSRTGPRGSRQMEEEADRLAVRLTRAAGYGLGRAEAFLADVTGATASSAGTHPALDRRLALLRAEIAANGG